MPNMLTIEEIAIFISAMLASSKVEISNNFLSNHLSDLKKKTCGSA